jgi:hypothetical protein
MKKTFVVLSIALVSFFATGCFEIEQSINLKKDLSGTADFHLGVDLEPMIVVMAQVGRSMEGKKGPMTDAELAKVKADFKKQSAEKKSESEGPSRAEIEKSLPKGVTLLDFAVKERDFGVDSDFKFGFDSLKDIVNVKLPSKGDDPTKKSIMDTPFEGLELIEKGDTITLQTKPVNPAQSVKEQEEAANAPTLDPDTEKIVKQAFEKMRVAYRITAPFRIISHNANRQEGDTLIWEYDMKRFEQMEKSKKPDDLQVKVVYKR